MAYKFQLGTARLSGSATYIGDIDAGSNIKGVDVSGSGILKIAGTNASATIGDSLTFSNGGRINIRHINNPKITLEVTGAGLAPSWEYPRLRIFKSASNSVVNVSLDHDNRADEYRLALNNGSGVNGWMFNDESTGNIGNISGSANLEVKGNVTIGGNATVAGDLTVNGDTVALNSDTQVESGFIQVSASAADDAASQGAGFIFGQASNANGGLIIYSSGSEPGKHIAIQYGDGAAAPFKANRLLGDGSNLTGISSTSRYSLNELSASIAGTALAVSQTNIITNAPDAGVQKLILPNTGSGAGEIAAGEIIKIKLQATANENNFVIIEGPASADPKYRIDGQLQLELMSPSASLDLIYLGAINSTGSFAIF